MPSAPMPIQPNPYLPQEAGIVDRVQESEAVFTLRLRFTDPALAAQYAFEPGQFNTVYSYGVGEAPISIVSDPQDSHLLNHTIRAMRRDRAARQNQARMEEELRTTIEREGAALPDGELRLRAESLIRSYDPCISCATYFLDLRIERE